MSAELVKSASHERAVAIALGHALRSEMIDAFALLEQAIVTTITRAGIEIAATAAMSQKLFALDKAAFRHPVKAQQRIGEIRALADVRNDVVHSTLDVAELRGDDSGTAYLFRNCAHPVGRHGAICRVITAEAFKTLTRDVKMAAKHLTDQQLKAATPAARAAASG